jgi:hypothetical protein
MPINSPIFLTVVAAMDGYGCLLVPNDDGSVFVAYPNVQGGAGEKLHRESSYYVPEQMHFGTLTAQPPAGPSWFVFVSSAQPVSLAQMAPPGPLATFVDINGATLDPDRVGPGLLGTAGGSRDERGVDALPAESWEAATICLMVH